MIELSDAPVPLSPVAADVLAIISESGFTEEPGPLLALPEQVDEPAVWSALWLLSERHSVLRTHLRPVGTGWGTRLGAPNLAVAWVGSKDRAVAPVPVDPARAPALRVRLARAGQKSIASLSANPVLCDLQAQHRLGLELAELLAVGSIDPTSAPPFVVPDPHPDILVEPARDRYATSSELPRDLAPAPLGSAPLAIRTHREVDSAPVSGELHRRWQQVTLARGVPRESVLVDAIRIVLTRYGSPSSGLVGLVTTSAGDTDLGCRTRVVPVPSGWPPIDDTGGGSPDLEVAVHLAQHVPADRFSQRRWWGGGLTVSLTEGPVGPQLWTAWTPGRVSGTTRTSFLAQILDTIEILLRGGTANQTRHGPGWEAEVARLGCLASSEPVGRPWPSLIDQLLHRAERTPEAPAVTDGTRQATFGEFVDEVRTTAAGLAAAGVGAGDVVGVALERSIDLTSTIFATQWLGATYLPLDPDLPTNRLAGMIDDAQPVLIVTDQDGLEQNARRRTPHDLRSGDSPVPAPVTGAPSTLPSYLLYTSGSTGRPKGALIATEAILARLSWMQSHYPIGPGWRVLHKTPISFDVSVWELLWTFVTGAELVLATPGGHLDMAYLHDVIEEHDVHVMHVVPSVLSILLAEAQPDRLRSLRHVFSSGESLSGDLAAATLRALPEAQLHNLYGPTEAAIDVTEHTCDGAEAQPPIGHAVAGTCLKVYAADGELSPVGGVGELVIAGLQVGEGYCRRPSLTAQHFLPDPDRPGARMYCTGDLARYRDDGSLEYLGRRDHQVKLHGVRIELGEIEALLRADPGISDAAVIVSRHGDADVLKAFVVVTGTWDETRATQLLQALQADLPTAMVPLTVTALPTMPLTASGKLDRQALSSHHEERHRQAIGR